MSDWWTERALIMLKFLLKTRQRWLCRIRAHGQWHGKRVLFATARREELQACSLRTTGVYHGNAEVICHWQPVSACGKYIE